MSATHRLRIWGPDGEVSEVRVRGQSDLIPALTSRAAELGCLVGELDYQIDGGVRMLGEASAAKKHIDVCGLPRK